MTTAEKTAYVNAILALKADTTSPRPAAAITAGAKNRYDVFVWVHSMVMNGSHKGAAFTPWHREFLRQFELELQAVSGNSRITIPYWDCVTGRTSSDAGFPFTSNFMGGLGTGADNRVMTGAFAESAGWVLNVITGQATGVRRDNTTYLRRRTGQNPSQLPELPDLNMALTHLAYDATPFAEGGNRPSPSAIAASYRKILEYDLHNGPHEWIGGNMMPHTAPNDPVFFLHHSNIDRIWAIWQQRPNGGIANYQPGTGTPLHSLNSVMAMLDSGFYRFPVLNRPSDVLDHKALGYMYDVDLPRITGVPNTLDFGMVLRDATRQLPIIFNIEAGRNMKFRVNAFAGDPGFHLPDGTPANRFVNHTNGNPQILSVPIEFKATSQTGSKSGMVQINVYVKDSERYFSNVSGDYLAGTWSINLVANVVSSIPTAIIAEPVVSGSMALEPANGATPGLLNLIENPVLNEEIAQSTVTSWDMGSHEATATKSSMATSSGSKKIAHPEHDMPDSPNMDIDMDMELISFKVNEKGAFVRVEFTHDQPCKKPKHIKKKAVRTKNE